MESTETSTSLSLKTCSSEYQTALQSQHSSRPPNKKWGTTGARNAGSQIVSTLRGRGDVNTVLDFGAGQGSLGKYVTAELPYLKWSNYDPGIRGIDTLPEGKFDFIVSSDVLEHVEPERVDEVILWLKAHTRKGMFHHIACAPTGKLFDSGPYAGQDLHLTVREPAWWREKIVDSEFSLMYYADCEQRKRGGLRRHAIIQVDKLC